MPRTVTLPLERLDRRRFVRTWITDAIHPEVPGVVAHGTAGPATATMPAKPGSSET
jgi:hypothetical protein